MSESWEVAGNEAPEQVSGGRKALTRCRKCGGSAGVEGRRSFTSHGDPDTTAVVVGRSDPGLRAPVPEGPGGSENTGF